MCSVLGWRRGFLQLPAQDGCGHISNGEAELWEEARIASIQKLLEKSSGKEQVY